MPTTFTCPHGHQWQVELAAAGQAPRCPTCTHIAQAAETGQQFQDANTAIVATQVEPLPAAGTPAVPGYVIEGVLGSGGMGIVYRARQLSLKRMVGLKMLLSAEASPETLSRFRAEAEAVAQLQHANIVQIHDIGEYQGRPFFAMELVEGTSLARALAKNLFSFRDTALLVATLARAIHFAHERGIIHRDLKPANVLLQMDASVSTAAEHTKILNLQAAVPKITDFGLVKRLDDSGPTLTGEVLGTPSYMPPEQATGDIAAIGPATDIYGLGAILYEMLTGRPPFHGVTTAATLEQLLNEEPLPPGRLRSHLPPDLETICLTCLQKEPGLRYAGADKLAADLERYLAGLSIQARPAGRRQRWRRWMQAHPATVLFSGVGGLALVGAAVGLWLQSPLAIGALAVVSLCLGAWWYSARLERALLDVRRQNLFSLRSVERMHLLLETVHRLLAARDLDERLRILGDASARLVDAERATIFLIDKTRGELWSKLATGTEPGEIRIPMGSGIAGSVAQTGRTINLADPYSDPRFNPDVDRRTGYTTRNLLTVPMMAASGARLGVFQVLNKRGGPFGPEDVEILAQLARAAALVVGN